MSLHGKEVWVAYADDHDYDCMSQWLVGVFETEVEAMAAVVIDRKLYVKRGGTKNSYNYEITKTIIGKLKDHYK